MTFLSGWQFLPDEHSHPLANIRLAIPTEAQRSGACPERSRMGTCGSINQHSKADGSAPFPLSSRAKPRDLQFRGPFLEMFFEEAVWASRPVGPTAKRQPSPGGLGHKFPNLPERRRRGTLSPQPASILCRKTFPGRACRTADPSASLGMTKGGVALPSSILGWWREPQVPIRLSLKEQSRYAPSG